LGIQSTDLQQANSPMSGKWRAQPERGSRNALRLIIWLALHCGRPLCRVLLVPVSAYFFITAPLARRSSQAFMGRALERRPTWRDTFSHLFVFGTTLLDRIYLVNGRQRELTVGVKNESTFQDAMKAGRGCLLLGSHLGSFEMLGIIGSIEKKLVINMVMHLDQGAHLRNLMVGSGQVLPYNVIPLGQPGSMLRVKECLARGEVVGILADRVYGDEPTLSLPFLGRPARFSLSPWRLAKITGAPMVAVFGLFHGGRRYEIVFESLAEPVESSRDAAGGPPSGADSSRPALKDLNLVTHNGSDRNRDHAKHPAMTPVTLQSYVEHLERHARQFPYNWFNFYDYWSA
jgi:predicted LPLAT superfamily acyltransferase